jgi:hypothetical protein
LPPFLTFPNTCKPTLLRQIACGNLEYVEACFRRGFRIRHYGDYPQSEAMRELLRRYGVDYNAPGANKPLAKLRHSLRLIGERYD